jgi:hypothetical protein
LHSRARQCLLTRLLALNHICRELYPIFRKLHRSSGKGSQQRPSSTVSARSASIVWHSQQQRDTNSCLFCLCMLPRSCSALCCTCSSTSVQKAAQSLAVIEECYYLFFKKTQVSDSSCCSHSAMPATS